MIHFQLATFPLIVNHFLKHILLFSNFEVSNLFLHTVFLQKYNILDLLNSSWMEKTLT